MMRTKFFLMMLAAIVMGSQVTLFAQEKKGAKSERRQFNKEQMLEIQCNQIIKGLALDDATTAKFIPVYKQYMEEMRATRHMGACRNIANRTAADKQTPNRFLQMLKWSRLSRHVSRRVERYWMFVRSIIMSSGNFFLLNKFRKCIIWRNTMAINSVKR